MNRFARRAAGALFAISVLAAPSAAEKLVDATDPAVIANIASGYGSSALTADEFGDPMVEGRIDGLLYYVFFYGCEANRNCTAIQFSASFEQPGMDLAGVNDWNSNKRFGAASLDEDGDVSLQYDLNLAYGVSRANLDDTFDYWRTVLGEFRDHLGW